MQLDASGSHTDALKGATLVLLLLACVGLSASYGSSFLLVDLLQSNVYPVSTVGSVISAGTVATIATAVVSGRLAAKMGLMRMLQTAAGLLGLAMICFSLVGRSLAFAYLGGLLLGVGWSAFYMVAPLLMIQHVGQVGRLKHLMLVSGAQMFGIGVAAPFGGWIAGLTGRVAAAYLIFGVVCLVAFAFFAIAQKGLGEVQTKSQADTALSFTHMRDVLCSRAAYPILMIGIGACVFAALSTFQSVYAASRGLNSDVFFLSFTVTVVALRFAAAPLIERVPLVRVSGVLVALSSVGLALLYVNDGEAATYLAGGVLFAAGYGLTYSTLNGIALTAAEQGNIPPAIVNQVFTLSYFLGLFGFPYFAGLIVDLGGVRALLVVLIALLAVNGLMLAQFGFCTSRKPSGR